MALSKLAGGDKLFDHYRPTDPNCDYAERRKGVMLLAAHVTLDVRYTILRSTLEKITTVRVPLTGEGEFKELYFRVSGLHIIASDTKKFKDFSTRICLHPNCDNYPNHLGFACNSCYNSNPYLRTEQPFKEFREIAYARSMQIIEEAKKKGPIPVLNEVIPKKEPPTQ